MNLEYGWHIAYRDVAGRLRDPAQAWIEGDKEPALKAQRLHEAKINARMLRWKNVKSPKMRKALILRLRSEGLSLSQIAVEVGITRRSVCRILSKYRGGRQLA